MKWFLHLAGPKPELKNIVYSDSRFEKRVFRFLRLLSALSFEVWKKCFYDRQFFFSNNFDKGIKNAEIDDDFGSVEKLLKSSYEKSYWLETVGIMYLYTFQYGVRKFLAL